MALFDAFSSLWHFCPRHCPNQVMGLFVSYSIRLRISLCSIIQLVNNETELTSLCYVFGTANKVSMNS